MKKILLLLSAALTLGAAEPVLNFDGKNFSGLRKITSDGRMSSENLSAVMDGKTALFIKNKHQGAQTVLVSVKYPGKPSGVLISRNRQQDGYRGLELNFGSRNAFDVSGYFPAGVISAGTKKEQEQFIFPDVDLAPGKEYTFITRFEPEKFLDIIILDSSDKKVAAYKQVDVSNISSQSAGAGNGLMVFGGRRAHNRSVVQMVPDGTVFRRITLWNDAVSDARLSKLTGILIKKVENTASTEKQPEKKVAAVNKNPVTLHVDCSKGSDRNSGTSAQAPLKTIQAAADRVNPGDTVLVAPGVYFETVVFKRPGTEKQPVTIKAAGKPGSVVITAADEKLRTGKSKWECVDEKLQLYRTKFSHSPCRMLYSGVDLFPYNTLDDLKEFVVTNARSGKATEGSKTGMVKLPAARHGFYFDEADKYLYVRLHEAGRYGSRNPADHVISAGAVAAPGSNGHHIYAPEHSNVYIDCGSEAHYFFDGIHFETPGAAGLLTCSGRVVVRNSIFKGCRFGVWSRGVTEGVFIENCYYDHAHSYNDANEIIEKYLNTEVAKDFPSFHWTRKRNYKNSRKLVNYETGIAGGAGKLWHIRNCDIVDAFEALSCWCMNNTKSWRVYGNNMQRLIDNAVEAENNACDLRIHNNLFVDIFEPMSYQPLGGMPWPGPVFVYRNVYYNTPGVAPLLSVMGGYRGAFKMGIPGANWSRVHMNSHKPDNSDLECRFTKRVVFVPYPGYMVFNNTVLLKEHVLFTLPMPVKSRCIANMRFFNNILECSGLAAPTKDWDGDMTEFYRNAVVKSDPNGKCYSVMADQKGFITDSRASFMLDKNYTPSAASPLLGKGSLSFREPDASVDLGAVHRKGKFQLSAGVGKAVDVSKLSVFRQRVFYNAEMLRSEGPEPGSWAVYYISGVPVLPEKGKSKIPYCSDGQPLIVDMPELQNRKELTITFRAADNSGKLLKLDNRTIGFVRKGNRVAMVSTKAGKVRDIAQFDATRDEYVTVRLSENGVFVNGTKCGSSCAVNAGKCQVIIGYNPVFDVI